MAYQEAKARTRSKYLHSAIIVPATDQEGFYIYTMALQMGMLFPSGRVWYATEAEAKQHCLETMKIKETDWVTREGEPEFAAAFGSAVVEAIKNYTEGTKDDSGPAGR
jgi:hypothetical protein